MNGPDSTFAESVERSLSDGARELWKLIADEFIREGPDAAQTYLDAERARLESVVRSRLERFTQG